jgi:aspartyl protease family protein
VTFLVDTGATDVAIPAELAKQLRLPRQGGVVSRTANGAVAGWRSELDSLHIGGIALQRVRATVLPSMADDGVVLLGMAVLKRLELVQRGRRLTLRVPAD